MKHSIINTFIHPSLGLITLLVFIFLGSWVLNYFYLPDYQSYSAAAIRIMNPDALWLNMIVFSATLINLFLIAQINSQFSIVRVKTFLPVFFYALFVSLWKESHFLCLSHVVLTVFLIALMLFLRMYRNQKAVEPAFVGTFLLSLTGIINPIYLFLIPFSWIGFAILRCFSLKIFLASLIGTLTPWILYISYHAFYGIEITIFDTLIAEFRPHFLYTGRNIYEQIYIAFIILVLVICTINIVTNRLDDSIQTRKNIILLLIYLLFMVFMIFIFAIHTLAYLPFLAFFIAFIFAHPFSVKKSKFYSTLFILFLIVNVLYAATNYLIS